jgi:CO dehydrogenase maturation factor
MERKTKILALVGKGGVGKTTLCSAFVRLLSEQNPEARILAIDADPAVGLATALGVEVKETLDDLRLAIIEKAAQGAGKEAVELLGEVRYRIFDALVEAGNIAFLAIGRPEGAGCYCAVNAYLKEVIEMISKDFDYVVIDGEAGLSRSTAGSWRR